MVDTLEEILQPLKFCKLLIKYIGLQQDGKQSWMYFFAGHILHLIFFELFIILNVAFLFTGVNWQEQVSNFSVLVQVGCIMFKMYVYLSRLNSVEKLHKILIEVLKISSDHQSIDRAIIQKKIKTIKKVMKAFASFLTINMLYGVVVVIVFREIPHKIYYPFKTDLESSLSGFVIAAIYQNLVCLYPSTFLFFIDTLPVIFMTIASGLLDELAIKFDTVGNTGCSYKETLQCIRVHEKVVKLVHEIENQFGLIFFIQFLVSTVAIGFSVFVLSTASDASNFVFFFVYTLPILFDIYLPCYYGHELMLSSENLIDATKNSGWSKANRKTKQALMIFLEEAKKPIKISYRRLREVNLVSFADIIQSAYSLYAVLKSVNN